MYISRDPDGIPEIDMKLIQEAEQGRWQVLHVICDEEEAEVGDESGLAFWALAPFIPRSGERIRLQDKTFCVVADVIWRTVKRKTGSFLLVPTVYAVRQREEGSE